MREQPTHKEEYKGYTIKIYPDTNCEDPRKWDEPLGKMVCWHRRYDLGDKHNYSSPRSFYHELATELDPTLEQRIEYWENGNGWKSLSSAPNACQRADAIIDKAIQKVIDRDVVMLPLYLFDHSGITMRTHPFSCRWDSGQVGYIFATREQIKKEYSVKIITKKIRNHVCDMLIGEVKTYDQFLTGDVYGFVVEDNEEEHIDSCWGFYGNEAAIQAAKEEIDWHVKKEQEAEDFWNTQAAL